MTADGGFAEYVLHHASAVYKMPTQVSFKDAVLLTTAGTGLYGLDAGGLRPVHEWTGGFERFWNESFDRLDAYVQDLKQARQED